RLTASLPRQRSVLLETRVFWTLTYVCRWSWRRDLNPRPADYKSAALPTELRQLEQKVNFSTSYASRASCPPFFRRLSTVQVVARSATPYCTQLKVDGSFSLPDR